MVHIAQRDSSGTPAIGHMVAKELAIPEGFLLRILVALSRAGLLRSIKGPNGGYNLARAAKSITLLDIIEAAEGPLAATADPVSTPPDAVDKKLQALAASATEAVRKEMSRITLADLSAGRKGKR
jgi:Rrf2 family protein